MLAPKKVVLGKISSPFGVRGWVKVFSYTDPLTNILDYSPWQLQHNGELQTVSVVTGQKHGKGIIVLLENCASAEDTLPFIGANILVNREDLPPVENDEYYWSDLIGLTVFNMDNVNFGKIQHIIETGANEVLIVQGERERLIPFGGSVIKKVDLIQGIMTVDWDASF